MTHDVFISYSARDKTVADAACAALEANGRRCWIAPRDVLPGHTWAAALVEAIASSRILVLILSEGSNASPQVNREVGEAVDNGLPIIPFRIEDVEPSDEMRYYIKSIHWLDALTPPLERHLSRLTALVDAALEVDAAEETAASAPATAVATSPPLHRSPSRSLAIVGAALALVIAGSVALVLARSGSNSGTEEQTLSFVIPNATQWSSPAPGAYSATGSDDTFAWTEEIVDGDFVLEVDVTSDFASFGEGMLVVYGDGLGWSRGSLIFNVTGYWQAVRAHTIYDGVEWLHESEMVLDTEATDTSTMKIEVIGDFATLYVDGEKVAAVVLSPAMNRQGRIALVKYGQSAPVTFSNIRFDPSPDPTATTAEPRSTPQPETEGAPEAPNEPATAPEQAAVAVNFEDDFDGVLGDGWSWMVEDPDEWSLEAVPGWLQLTETEIEHNILVRDAPTGPFEFTTAVQFRPTSDFQFAGLIVGPDQMLEATFLQLGRAYCDPADIPRFCVGDGIYIDNLENGQFVGSSSVAEIATDAEVVYLRIVADGDSYEGYVSDDGESWDLVGRHARSFGDAQIGLVAHQAYEAPAVAEFDYFAVTSPPEGAPT